MRTASVVFVRASCNSTRDFAGFSSPEATKPNLSSSTSLLRSTIPCATRVLRTTTIPFLAALASSLSAGGVRLADLGQESDARGDYVSLKIGVDVNVTAKAP